MPSRRIWLITGTSSSLGHWLCLTVLATGDLVIALAASQRALERVCAAGAYGIQVDSDTSFSHMKKKIRDAVSYYGGIDIVVNNPDYDSPQGNYGSYGPVDTYYANTFSYSAIQVTKCVSDICDVRQIVMIALGPKPQLTYSSEMEDNVEGAAELFAAEYRPRRIRVLLAKPYSLHSASGSLIPSYDIQTIAGRIVEKVREGGFSELGMQVM